MVRDILRGPLAGVVVFLVFVGVAASATFYLRKPVNPGFLDFPTIVALHVVLGGLYLLFAPFQFVRRIRSKHRLYHRWAGRALVALGLATGVTALFMGLVIPASGWPERVVIGLFGSVFLVALHKGFAHIRARRVRQHREWMIRAFSIGLSIATQRLIFIPSILVIANPTNAQIEMLSVVAFAAAFLVHACVAEAWIRLTRKCDAPQTGTTLQTGVAETSGARR
ncbi:putative membrane protein (DUF2306) (plasmid) [Rubrobacter radiotolerans]|uniref:DUF2306 domain-containing protein n=1 Tax=Rubrobacter radiotolerans TaxID=42256 RepID=A0A023X7T5_RUBRA|nr:DUF2306 domain-containing protein [Rubrobacter radiotolerans]AHY48114.1 putative membrane protein (DUF2306) [Rubrobacter radiotolerans]MDX5895387.1 DUF2306 domain-containing protein [Rubrobacter radiotolerans]SMC01745.1 Predicted membrane protein [Rubrobacter radiotolerans DSM 5868]